MNKGELQLQHINTDGDQVSVRIVGAGGISLSLSMNTPDFFGVVDSLQKDMEEQAQKESLKAEKKKKKKAKVEPTTRFQKLTPVKFKNIKAGNTYRFIMNVESCIYEFVSSADAYPYNFDQDYHVSSIDGFQDAYSDEVKSVFLVEYSEVF